MDAIKLLRGILLCQVLANVGKALAETDRKVWPSREETARYWHDVAQMELERTLKAAKRNENVAKNVILFIGDGMGMPSIAAGRFLKGQMAGGLGEDYSLAMDKFPHTGLSRVYCLDHQTPDSGATATAFLSGVKTKYETFGLNGRVRRGECQTERGNEVDSILTTAHNAGKSTGVVTTTHVAHATPAAAYAHTADRNWYTDADMPQTAKNQGCKDIAKQFFENSNQITVTLGGGRKYFRSEGMPDEAGLDGGTRKDGRDLLKEWVNAAPRSEERSYVWNREQLNNIDVNYTDRLLGLFQPKYMSYEGERKAEEEPSIAEMVEKAIRILRKNKNGYFLLVEGGRIDQAHHLNMANLALQDVVAFDDAVAKAVEMTSDDDTLIIVSADHSHTMTIGGYAVRGEPVSGFALQYNKEMVDTKPATSILYGDGPGYLGSGTLQAVTNDPNAAVVRENLTKVDTSAHKYQFQSVVPRTDESHTGEDVPILARGPMAHLFNGVHEQNYIAHAMRFASCLDDEMAHCSSKSAPSDKSKTKVLVYILGMYQKVLEALVKN